MRKQKRSSRALGDLVVTEEQREQAEGLKAVGFVKMAPGDFLKLTTPTDTDVAEIAHEARSLDEYNSFARRGETIIPPFLDVDRKSGKVCGHEGRHRAAALQRDEPGTPLDVAIVLREPGCSSKVYYEENWSTVPRQPKRYLGADDVPDTLHAEFKPRVFSKKLDKTSWQPIKRGR